MSLPYQLPCFPADHSKLIACPLQKLPAFSVSLITRQFKIMWLGGWAQKSLKSIIGLYFILLYFTQYLGGLEVHLCVSSPNGKNGINAYLK